MTLKICLLYKQLKESVKINRSTYLNYTDWKKYCFQGLIANPNRLKHTKIII
jgi:hypothetical protein